MTKKALLLVPAAALFLTACNTMQPTETITPLEQDAAFEDQIILEDQMIDNGAAGDVVVDDTVVETQDTMLTEPAQ